MRRSLKKEFTLKRRQTGRNAEGGYVESWADPVTIQATTWQASGRAQAEMYGERLAYMRNMEYEGAEVIKENDGICVFVSADADPDYRVIAVNADYKPVRYLLEAIR
jgi:hypothetical protein